MSEFGRPEQALNPTDLIDEIAGAWLCIDPDNGLLGEVSAAAADLLGVQPPAAAGQHWKALFGGSGAVDAALALAVDAGVRTVLPPVLVKPPQRPAFVADGLVLPMRRESFVQTILLLRRLDEAAGYGDLATATIADTVVVLGVEQAPSFAQGKAAHTMRMMMDIRSGLIDMVRAQDSVGLPGGSAITLLLRDADLAAAQDISRALLSHLRTTIPVPGDDAGELRLRIGLAPAMANAGEGPLPALLAANRAMSRAWSGPAGESIRVATKEDASIAGALAISAGGIFSDNRPTTGAREFLSSLLQLVSEHTDARSLPQAVAGLVLAQTGVHAVAIYRRQRDDVFDCVAGAAEETMPGKVLTEEELPRAFRDVRRRMDRDQLERIELLVRGKNGLDVLPLRGADNVVGYVAVLRETAQDSLSFAPDAAAMHALARIFAGLRDWRENPAASLPKQAPVVSPMETGIGGYVGDNMEGAVDQAVFLAGLDVPVAIIGPRGTGKMYVARIIHREWGGEADHVAEIDCREFHSRKQADARIGAELRQGEGKTLVFKSAHLMNADAQLKLARQISSRTLADVTPPRYLPRVKLIALFPDNLEKLIRWDGLTPQLASVFAAYPIFVPPIKDRRQAVLRWAHKILGQECDLRERYVRGFTPDAEQAMLQHDWPGNISEMRRCIVDALDKTDKEWISPVDLGIFVGISPERAPPVAEAHPFLSMTEAVAKDDDGYTPSAFDALEVALGEAVNNLLARNSIAPLGTWLEDEVVLAVCDRYGNDMRGAADFLHTKPRNISRWLPKIRSREEQRAGSSLWQDSRRLVRDWIGESAQASAPPLQLTAAMLMKQVLEQGHDLNVADRARIMGVSVPTYHKRLQDSPAG